MFRTGLRTLGVRFGEAARLRGSAPNVPTGRGIWTVSTTARPALSQGTVMSQLRTCRTAATRTTGRAQPRSAARLQQQRAFHRTRPRRGEDRGRKHEAREGPQEKLSLSGRLKKLTREYGWAAAGIYLGLSVLDFPFCFLLVRTVGSDKIAHVEHVVVSTVANIIPDSVQEWWAERRRSSAKGESAIESSEVDMYDHGVAQAQERRKQEGASLATELALAYAIHKSFIFVRVPLTAAVTPKVVKVLRSWGWQIGKNPLKHKGKR
ncbi:hypothetical protein VTJ83DRAFT_7222 [Remersonia thermophila]|uniref:DUF1279 domain-containing protein n=1 Tax=Remersonia thermophila TaxID=72144 RepID=A0ABR4D2W1_9PEZI